MQTLQLEARFTRLRRNLLISLAVADLLVLAMMLFFAGTLIPFAYWGALLLLLPLHLAVFLLLRSLRRRLQAFHAWLEASQAKGFDSDELNSYWKRLTRLPVAVSLAVTAGLVLAAITIQIILVSQHAIFGFQFLTGLLAMSWFSTLAGLVLYSLIRSFILPYLSLLARFQLHSWAGPKVSITVKLVLMVFILTVLPGLYLVRVGARQAILGVRSLERTEASRRLEQALGRLASAESLSPSPDLWSDPPQEWFWLDPSGRRRAGNAQPPPLPPGLGPGVQVLPTSDFNTEWLVARSAPGDLLGLKLSLDFFYPELQTMRLAMNVPLAAMIISSLVIVLLLGRDLSRPLREMQSVARELAQGEAFLERNIQAISDDEIGDLSLAFHRLLDRIREQYLFTRSLLEEMRNSVRVLGGSTEEMSAVTRHQTQELQAQVARVQETALAARQIASGADEINQQAAEVEQAAEVTVTACHTGEQTVTAIVGEISGIRDQAVSLRRQMGELREVSEEIRTILDLINSIASRTELLALNAALEAAAAGEGGRRFAVVAQEVKRLAVTSGEASGQVGDRTRRIQARLEEIVAATDLVAEQVISGGQRVNSIREDFSRLVKLAGATTAAARNILSLTGHQQEGNQKLVAALTGVERISREMLQAAEEVQKSISDLFALARQLADRSGPTP